MSITDRKITKILYFFEATVLSSFAVPLCGIKTDKVLFMNTKKSASSRSAHRNIRFNVRGRSAA